MSLVLIVVTGLVLVPQRARADSSSEALFVERLEAATLRLLERVIPEPVSAPLTYSGEEEHSELSDWIDPSSGSTAHAGRACDQRYVAYLTGTRGRNYLDVKLFNDSDAQVTIHARSAVFEETERTSRRSRDRAPSQAGHSGQFLSYKLQKAPFKELTRLEIVFELSFTDGRACQLKVDFSRTRPAVPASYKLYSRISLGLSYGGYLTSGSLRDTVGELGASRTTLISWYPAMQHGIVFELGADRLHSDHFATGVLLLPSYEYRIFISPRVSYEFGIGAGAYVFTVYQDVPASAARGALIVRERMQLKFELFPPDLQTASFALSPTVSFGVLPGGPFGPRELSGGLFAGTLELTLNL